MYISNLTEDDRAKPKSLFAKTSTKNLGVGSSMFGEHIANEKEKNEREKNGDGQ